MNINQLKLELTQLLLKEDNPKILELVNSILNRKKNSYWSNLSPEMKKDINEGLRDVVNEDYVEYESFMKKYRDE